MLKNILNICILTNCLEGNYVTSNIITWSTDMNLSMLYKTRQDYHKNVSNQPPRRTPLGLPACTIRTDSDQNTPGEFLTKEAMSLAQFSK